jgi:crotonobetainyl-CoA:carnitine CoA-transferase CaiB-like acyl-CoA transferase
VPTIGRLLELPEVEAMTDPQSWWDRQEEIEELLSERLRTRTRDEWLAVLDAEDVWCAPVLTLDELVEHDGFRAIAMTQQVRRDGLELTTTRSPIRIDGERLTNPRPGPRLGEHDPLGPGQVEEIA